MLKKVAYFYVKNEDDWGDWNLNTDELGEDGRRELALDREQVNFEMMWFISQLQHLWFTAELGLLSERNLACCLYDFPPGSSVFPPPRNIPVGGLALINCP